MNSEYVYLSTNIFGLVSRKTISSRVGRRHPLLVTRRALMGEVGIVMSSHFRPCLVGLIRVSRSHSGGATKRLQLRFFTKNDSSYKIVCRAPPRVTEPKTERIPTKPGPITLSFFPFLVFFFISFLLKCGYAYMSIFIFDLY